jgi:hypothetical protein
MAVRLSALPAAIYHQKDLWYSFLLEAELISVPLCIWKEYGNWNIQWPHTNSNPQPSTFYHSAWSNYSTAYTRLCWELYFETVLSDSPQNKAIRPENAVLDMAAHTIGGVISL